MPVSQCPVQSKHEKKHEASNGMGVPFESPALLEDEHRELSRTALDRMIWPCLTDRPSVGAQRREQASILLVGV